MEAAHTSTIEQDRVEGEGGVVLLILLLQRVIIVHHHTHVHKPPAVAHCGRAQWHGGAAL